MWTSKISGWTAILLPLIFIYSLSLLYRYAISLWTGTPKFDPYVAASLHNQLVSKIPIEVLEEHNAIVIHNWFLAYGKEAGNVRGRLSKSLIKFLENVDVPVNRRVSWSTVGVVPNLTLSSPGDMWVQGGGMDWDGGTHADEDWVVLYRDNIAVQADLYFDMNNNLVTCQEEFMSWNENWYSLERILRMWNDMYDTGRFMSGSNNDSFSGGMNSWDVRPYTASDFVINLAAWHECLDAIVSYPSQLYGISTIGRSMKPGMNERLCWPTTAFLYTSTHVLTSDRWHNPRLFTMLRAWKRLVEDGIWKVEPDGIKGGIERFQEAGAGRWKSKFYKLGACYDEV